MNDHIKWIAHRGNRIDFDENTQAAFESSIKNGYTHVETDLRITADNEVVHWHDLTLSDHSGKIIAIGDATRKQLEKVRLPKGGKLMFFDEFSAHFGGISWTLDIKPESGLAVLARLIEDERKYNWTHRSSDLRFLLWQCSHLKRASEIQSPLQRYAGKWECIRAGLSVAAKMPVLGNIHSTLIYSLPPKFMGIEFFQTPKIKPFHHRGARVIAFLPSTVEEAKAAIAAGFDEILSDFPSPI